MHYISVSGVRFENLAPQQEEKEVKDNQDPAEVFNDLQKGLLTHFTSL